MKLNSIRGPSLGPFRRTIVARLWLWLVWIAPLGLQAQFNVTTNNNEITIVSYAGTNSTAVEIPDWIDGHPVTQVGDFAFYRHAELTRITLGTNVTYIGSAAFQECTGLLSVTLPDSVTILGGGAFYRCSSLTEVALGQGLATLGGASFTGCPRLRAFKVAASNPIFSSADGVLYSSLDGRVFVGPGGVLVRCPEGKTGTCQIAEGVRILAREAFSGCTGITAITVPDSVGILESRSFAGCSLLGEVTLGRGVASVAVDVFTGFPQLRAIHVAADNPVFSSVDGVLLGTLNGLVVVGRGAVLVRCPPGRTGTCRIPEGVRILKSGAFQDCTSLVAVTVPASVETIEDSAFFNCPNLRGIYFEGSPPSGVLRLSPFPRYYVPGTGDWASIGAKPFNLEMQTTASREGIKHGRWGFYVTGASDSPPVFFVSFGVDVCTNLARPVWTRIATNTFVGTGLNFVDTQWTNSSARFYRLGMP